MAYRHTLQIIGDILEVANEQGMTGANTSQLLTKANLSYKTMQGFLEKLKATGMLSMAISNGSAKSFVLTQKGREYLTKYSEFESYLSAFGLN